MQKRLARSLVKIARSLAGAKCLPLIKWALRFAPIGKATSLASICLEEFPTDAQTAKYFSSGRPRWSRTELRLNPYCQSAKLFALTGFYQWEMTQHLLGLLDADHSGMLVDIGANFGYFSALWLSRPQTSVLAIEPIEENFALLQENLQSFGARAQLVQCCVGEEEGVVEMSYDPMWPMCAAVEWGGTRQIKMQRLATILREHDVERVDVLKCDAEGHDVQILNSAREVFAAQLVGTVFFEAQTWKREPDPSLEDLCAFLVAHGYREVTGLGDLCFTLTHPIGSK